MPMKCLAASHARTLVEIEEIGLFVRKRLFEELPSSSPLPTLSVLQSFSCSFPEIKTLDVPIWLGLMPEADTIASVRRFHFNTGIGGYGAIEAPTRSLVRSDAASTSWYDNQNGAIYYLISERMYTGLMRDDVWARWALLVDTAHFVLELPRLITDSDILEHSHLRFDLGLDWKSNALDWQSTALAASMAAPADGIRALDDVNGWIAPCALSQAFGIPLAAARARLGSYAVHQAELLSVSSV